MRRRDGDAGSSVTAAMTHGASPRPAKQSFSGRLATGVCMEEREVEDAYEQESDSGQLLFGELLFLLTRRLVLAFETVFAHELVGDDLGGMHRAS
jgi:hypothetical protein